MDTGHDYIALLLHDERAARLRGDAGWDRLVRTVARAGKPSRGRGRRRRAAAAPVVPLQPRRSDAGRQPVAEEESAQAQADRRTAS